MPDTPQSKALRRAVEVFGSATALSHWLKVPSDALIQWINGDGVPPDAIFLQIVDLLGSRDTKVSADASQSSSGNNSTAGIGSGMRVLIADDERDTLMTLGILLRSEGFNVQLVGAGPEVRNAVREFRPDAVLLGSMPGRDGYDIAKELTQEYGGERPVLIAISAHSSNSDRRQAEISGFHHHVSKPYDPEKLLGLLASLKR